MLIVAKQDDVDDLFAIWDTVTSSFLGVNLSKAKSVKIIMDKKNCSEKEAESRCEHSQPFSDIARIIMNGYESDIDLIIRFFEKEIEIAEWWLTSTSPMFNGVNVGFENAEKLRKAHIRYCQNIIDRIRSCSL